MKIQTSFADKTILPYLSVRKRRSGVWPDVAKDRMQNSTNERVASPPRPQRSLQSHGQQGKSITIFSDKAQP